MSIHSTDRKLHLGRNLLAGQPLTAQPHDFHLTIGQLRHASLFVRIQTLDFLDNLTDELRLLTILHCRHKREQTAFRLVIPAKDFLLTLFHIEHTQDNPHTDEQNECKQRKKHHQKQSVLRLYLTNFKFILLLGRMVLHLEILHRKTTPILRKPV